jgi:hypothetical protein
MNFRPLGRKRTGTPSVPFSAVIWFLDAGGEDFLSGNLVTAVTFATVAGPGLRGVKPIRIRAGGRAWEVPMKERRNRGEKLRPSATISRLTVSGVVP